MDGDGRWDVVTLEYTKMYWLRRPADPAAVSAVWDLHTIKEGADYADQHGGLALGDIDGDGDDDIFTGLPALAPVNPCSPWAEGP